MGTGLEVSDPGRTSRNLRDSNKDGVPETNTPKETDLAREEGTRNGPTTVQ